jgi:hypothetical protein
VLLVLFVVMAFAAGLLLVLGMCVQAAAGDRALAAQLAAASLR